MKKGQVDIAELLWRFGKYIFAAMFVLLLWQVQSDRILGRAVEKGYLARDLALMNDMASHLPGDLEVNYDPLNITLKDYRVEMTPGFVIVGQQNDQDRAAHPNNPDLSIYSAGFIGENVDRIVYVKQGDSLKVGKVGEKLDGIVCVPPKDTPSRGSLILDPLYSGTFPGHVNPVFRDLPSDRLTSLSEAGKTSAFADSLKVKSQGLFSSTVLTRGSGSELPTMSERMDLTEHAGVYAALEIGWDPDKVSAFTAYYRSGSDNSKFLACLIAKEFEERFPKLTSVQYKPLPSLDSVSSDSAVRLRIGNLRINDSILTSAENANVAEAVSVAFVNYFAEGSS